MAELRRRDSNLYRNVVPEADESNEDGPAFRLRLTELEKSLQNLRKKVKQIVKYSEDYVAQQRNVLATEQALIDLLLEASGDKEEGKIPALIPVADYLQTTRDGLMASKEDYINQLDRLLVTPLKEMGANDLDSIDEKKKAFEKDSAEYYGYQNKYLAVDKQRKKSTLGKKDQQFLQRRAEFNLRRFDYLTFMEELHTKKQEELLYHVSTFPEKRFQYFSKSMRFLESKKPLLDQLTAESKSSWAEISTWTKDRQTIRKNIEVSNNAAAEAIEKVTIESPNKYRGIRDLDASIDPTKNQIEKKEGFLFVLKKGAWKQVWCEVHDGVFYERSHWLKAEGEKPAKQIDVRTCTVKEAFTAERRFCFEIISPVFRKTFQASSDEDMKTWIGVIQKAIEISLQGKKPNQGEHNEKNQVWTDIIVNKSNQFCADCGANDPDWGSINLGILICIECSGIHRSLGTHISKVRSLALDTTSWTPGLVLLHTQLGNELANSVWEANMEAHSKPLPNSSRDEKQTFIKQKYVERLFVKPIQNMTKETLLLQAVHDDVLVDVVHALALGADINCISPYKSECQGKGPLHLAIENGDPVITELLVQNFADIDLQDYKKNTALHYAVLRNDTIQIKYLLQKGAKKDLQNSKKKTCLDLCSNTEVQELLQKP